MVLSARQHDTWLCDTSHGQFHAQLLCGVYLNLTAVDNRYLVIALLAMTFLHSTPSKLALGLLVTQSPSLFAQLLPPEADITCLGEQYDLTLPSEGDFDPNRSTMQQLCADPQLGGGLPGQHLGGRCRYDGQNMSNTRVVFDNDETSSVSQVLYSPRLMAACIYRCFCNFGVTNTALQPKITPYLTAPFPRTEWAGDQTYSVEIEELTDFDPTWLDESGGLFKVDVSTPRLPTDPPGGPNIKGLVVMPGYHWHRSYNPSPLAVVEIVAVTDQRDYARYGEELAFTYLSMDPANNIECPGDLPPFPLIHPYQTSDFRSLQEMCAVTFSGGNP